MHKLNFFFFLDFSPSHMFCHICIELLYTWNKIWVDKGFQSLILSAFLKFSTLNFFLLLVKHIKKNFPFVFARSSAEIYKNSEEMQFWSVLTLGLKVSEFLCIFWKITKISYARNFFLQRVLKVSSSFLCLNININIRSGFELVKQNQFAKISEHSEEKDLP